jgi:hypothetical protein
LSQFYRGGDDPASWGPARKFAKANQASEVSYDLFHKKWQVVDIGAFEVDCDGNCKGIQTGDQLHFVTSKANSDWLIYLDARKGIARGTGAILVGTEFNPEEEIDFTL